MEKMWRSTSLPYVLPNPEGQADAWSQASGTQELLEVGEVAPPADVAAALGLAGGEPAVVRRRLMRANGMVVELADSYYPPCIARGTHLAERRKIRGGAPTLLANLGHRPGRVEEDVEVRLATPGECAALEAPAGEPVMVLSRTTVSQDDQPIEVSRMVMRSGSRLHYEIEVN
ncbi:GntR family transcriptional regulator [Streptomyces virginiae]|uniref:GntR family transcriptional regulator n=1 Tax=Streptomyces virginiae TaxID=1961 RepID=UPI00341C8450